MPRYRLSEKKNKTINFSAFWKKYIFLSRLHNPFDTFRLFLLLLAT